MKRNRTAATVAALLLGLVVAACIPVDAEPARPNVTLWGDSFGETVAPHLPYVEHVYGGTAPCDWVGAIRDAPAPRTAVLLFVGNKLADGTCHYPSAVAAITNSLKSRGSRVIWIAAPVLPMFPQARLLLNRIYPNPEHRPANAIGGDVWLPQYRQLDQNHLNGSGALVFAAAIKEAVS